MTDIINDIIHLAIPVLLAVTCHEYAHGWAACKFGDDTAKTAGRLTFNPLKHLDPVGTLVFIITQRIGWARPVPVNPDNLKNPRKDMIWVSLAGPAANLIVAVLFAILFRLLVAGFELIPPFLLHPLIVVATYGVVINLGLAIFNLLPVPPLDGSDILSGLLPPHLAQSYEQIRPFGFIILLALIFTDTVATIIFPIIGFLADFLLGGF